MIKVKSEFEFMLQLIWYTASVALLALGFWAGLELWWAAIPLVITGLLINPLVYQKIISKLNFADLVNVRIPIVLATLIGATALVFTQEKVNSDHAALVAAEMQEAEARALKEAREAAALKAKNETLAEYAKNSETILSDLQKAIDTKDVELGGQVKDKYQKIINDPKLNELIASYDAMAYKVATDKEIETLKAAAAKLKVDDYAGAISTYKKLAELDPATKQYKSKVEKYTALKNKADLAAKKAAEAAAAKLAREKRIEAQFSSWDGSHRNFERLIKSLMNDPDSYEHLETRYRDNGKTIRVSCTFRGRNAFGGLVVNTKIADFDLDGNFVREIQ